MQGLGCGDFCMGVNLFEAIAAGNGPAGTGSDHQAGKIIPAAHGLGQHLQHCAAGDLIMPQVVALLIKLVENHDIISGRSQFPAFIEYFLDIAFTAGSGDDLSGNLGQPVKTLSAHALRENGNGFAGQKLGLISAAPAIIAGGGPDGLLAGGIKLAGDQPGNQATVGRPYLMGAGGKPFAYQGDDSGLHPRQLGRKFNGVDRSVSAAEFCGFILPGNAEQIPGVYIPEFNVAQFFFDAGGNVFGILLPGHGGNDDVFFSGPVYCPSQLHFIYF